MLHIRLQAFHSGENNVVWFLGCVSEMEIHPKIQDREHYESAMKQQGEQAIQSCQRIQTESIKGECILFAAKEKAKRRQDARPLCDYAPTQAWKEVCRFDVVDILGLTGGQAEQACAQTGTFQSRCMYHALLREEDSLASQFPVGKEQDLMNAILGRMNKLGIEEVEEEPLYAILTARIIARRFEAQWLQNRQLLFSSVICGTATENVCANAYRISIKQIGRGHKPSNCSLPMQVSTVTSSGLPGWEDSFEPQAQQAWKSLCHASHGPKKPPDHSSSKRSGAQ